MQFMNDFIFVVTMSLLRKLFCFTACILNVIDANDDTDSPKIIGGSDVLSAKEYPFMVSIQTLTGHHFCGGSIFDSSWVITAAHCDVKIGSQIVAGTITKGGNSVIKFVRYTKTHQEYDARNHRNDIALVRIFGQFDFTDTVKPIKLASEIPTSGSEAILTGWGRTSV